MVPNATNHLTHCAVADFPLNDNDATELLELVSKMNALEGLCLGGQNVVNISSP